MKDYILDVKSQLECNASTEYKNEHTTYNYTNEIVDENFDYFLKSKNSGLSAYKALLFFYDFLNENTLN